MARPVRLLALLAALVSLLLPSESSAFIRRDLPDASLFITVCETCRNDPVNNSDPTGLRAYGNDFIGPIQEPWDWRENEYTQTQVDDVYRTLTIRDRHIYNPGLDNQLYYRTENQKLLSQILGVPIVLVDNKTLSQGSSAGSQLEWLLGKADGVVAGIDKIDIPLVPPVDQAVWETRRAYDKALKDVKGTGGLVYGWMHSEGAIHGSRWANHVSEEDYRYLRLFTMGGGTHSFSEGLPIAHYANVNKLGKVDVVVRSAAGESRKRWGIPGMVGGCVPLVRKLVTDTAEVNYIPNVTRVTTPYSSFGDENYVHGLPTYAQSVVLPLAKEYFEANARKILYGNEE